MKSPPDPHYRHRFPAQRIGCAIWLYHVFSLSLREVELRLAGWALAGPTTKTVAEIATDHVFQELGRFSVAYRGLFGESPSATLRRVPSR